MNTQGNGIDGCLICGRGGSLTRGLCATHHSQFARARNSLTPELAALFETKLIAQGKVLPPQKPGRKSSDDPFKEMAKLLEKMEIDETLQVAEETLREYQTKNGTKSSKAPRKKKGQQ